MYIEIWPDFDDLPREIELAIVRFNALKPEEQSALDWMIHERRIRVQEIRQRMENVMERTSLDAQ